jgi:hypothetical protein
MRTVIAFVFVFGLGMAINGPLYLNGEGIRIAEDVSADRWSKVCTYYTPFRTFTVKKPLYSACETRRPIG